MLTVFLLTGSIAAMPLQESTTLGAAAPPAQKSEEPAKPHLIPAAKTGDLPSDSKDLQPVLLGPTTREAILAHRDSFRDTTARQEIKPEWAARWKAIDVPATLVVVFGSWCSDSQSELPGLLALAKERNPFVTIQYIGVYRDKKVEAGAWPKGIPPQVVEKVPTVWLFELQPGGAQKVMGSIVETPPNGQPMAEAVLDLFEKAK